MNFKEFLIALEHNLGYHHIPVNQQAMELSELFESSPVHGDLVSRLLRAIYSENRCQKFDDLVTLEKCNNAIAPIRLELVKAEHTDVGSIAFIDAFCFAVSDALTKGDQDETDAIIPEKKTSADIINLNRMGNKSKTWA